LDDTKQRAEQPDHRSLRFRLEADKQMPGNA
jgi:hypothetical protein